VRGGPNGSLSLTRARANFLKHKGSGDRPPKHAREHTHAVSLRVESASLDATRVTRELAISPTQTRVKGGRRSENSVWDKALWEFEVFPERYYSHWDALEAGLAALLKTLQPHTKNFRRTD
jgi:hypothetical protein